MEDKNLYKVIEIVIFRKGDNMKCANCGNINRDSLHDEGDVIYCSRCTHRTNKSTNKDDSVICPVCYYPRDRKAMYCRWCNDSSWGKYNPEAEKMNKEYQKTITDDNLAYGKYKNYKSTKKKKYRYNDYDYQTDYSINQSTDSTVEDIGAGIGLIVAAGLFLYGVGKGIYEKRKEKKLKEPSVKKKSLKERLLKK